MKNYGLRNCRECQDPFIAQWHNQAFCKAQCNELWYFKKRQLMLQSRGHPKCQSCNNYYNLNELVSWVGLTSAQFLTGSDIYAFAEKLFICGPCAKIRGREVVLSNALKLPKRLVFRFFGCRSYPEIKLLQMVPELETLCSCIELPNGHKKYPDFIVKPFGATRKVVEVYGKLWHTEPGRKVHGFTRWPEDTDSELLQRLYKGVGIDCLIVWEDTLNKEPELARNQVMAFIHSQ